MHHIHSMSIPLPFHDVKVTCSDHTFDLHRIILWSKIPYFRGSLNQSKGDTIFLDPPPINPDGMLTLEDFLNSLSYIFQKVYECLNESGGVREFDSKKDFAKTPTFCLSLFLWCDYLSLEKKMYEEMIRTFPPEITERISLGLHSCEWLNLLCEQWALQMAPQSERFEDQWPTMCIHLLTALLSSNSLPVGEIQRYHLFLKAIESREDGNDKEILKKAMAKSVNLAFSPPKEVEATGREDLLKECLFSHFKARQKMKRREPFEDVNLRYAYKFEDGDFKDGNIAVSPPFHVFGCLFTLKVKKSNSALYLKVTKCQSPLLDDREKWDLPPKIRIKALLGHSSRTKKRKKMEMTFSLRTHSYHGFSKMIESFEAEKGQVAYLYIQSITPVA